MTRVVADRTGIERPRFASRDSAVALGVAGGLAVGLGLLAGLAKGTRLDVAVATTRGVPSTATLVRGFDGGVALPIGCTVLLLAGLLLVAALRLHVLQVADRGDLSRRRAVVVAGLAAVPGLLAGLLVGAQVVTIVHTKSGHPGPPFLGEGVPWPPEHFALFDTLSAVVVLMLVFGSVALLGSGFRRSGTRA